MINPLYQQMNNTPPNIANMQNMIQRFRQFQQTFHGDPRQQVQNLLNSGRVTQAQYDNAVQMANQLQRMMKGQ